MISLKTTDKILFITDNGSLNIKGNNIYYETKGFSTVVYSGSCLQDCEQELDKIFSDIQDGKKAIKIR
jgi:hypothetical protein